VLDEQGRKMSKSLGNIVDPQIIIDGGKDQKKDPPYGADVLRLWASSVDYSSDMSIGKTSIKQMGDVRGKIRNTARFLLGNLHDFDREKDRVFYEDLPELDRYMLHRMTEVFTEVTAAFDSFQFFKFFQTVQNFCVVDLSNFYLDIAKDRLYISALDSPRRRSCQTVLSIAVENLARAIAPVLSHTAEDIWQYLPYPTPFPSVFQSGWVYFSPEWQQPALGKTWDELRQIRMEVNKVMEQARMEKLIGSSLEAKVLLYVADADLKAKLEELNPQDALTGNRVDQLRYLFIASQVEIIATPELLQSSIYNSQSEKLAIGIVKAEGQKCDRCWNYSDYVSKSSEHPLVCDRCEAALAGKF
jgi:isoleucyl-tRNA synthetase